MFKNQTSSLFITNGLTALAFAFILPIMSLFLVTELHAKPALIGLYTTITALMTVLVSQKLTGLIDKGISSKVLFVISLCGIAAASIGFSFAVEFWHALVIGGLLMPIASSSVPLILTIIRNYADSTGKNSAKLNSQMRSSVSLLWIFGPPLAFLSVARLGFDYNFYVSATIAMIVIIFVLFQLKEPQKPMGNNEAVQTDKLPRHIWFLVISIMFANMANSAYINAIPIYLTKELGVATSFPGILFGITAAIEIPAMLYSVTWAQRFGKVTVMKWGFVVALLFYASMYFSTSLTAFIILQLLNGLFFGIFVGLGITLMQDFAPNGIGKASAIYSNAMLLGTMIGTSSMGLISQFFGFKSPLLLSLFSVFISLCAMLSFERFSK